MLPPSKIQQGLVSILEYVVICENILGEWIQPKNNTQKRLLLL